jgi:hypothetical protein
MLSRIGRLFRRLVDRSAEVAGEPELPEVERREASEPAASELPPGGGNTLARDVLGRTGAITVSRRTIHRARVLPTRGARLPTYYAPPEVRRDVPMTELPFAVPRAMAALVAGSAPAPQGEHQTVFEETTGDAAWDALWALRGTPVQPAPPPPEPSVPPSTPAPSVEPPSGGTPSSVQRASERPALPRARRVQRAPEPSPTPGQAMPVDEQASEVDGEMPEPKVPPGAAPGPAMPQATPTEMEPAKAVHLPHVSEEPSPASRPIPVRPAGPVAPLQAAPVGPTSEAEPEGLPPAGDEVGPLPETPPAEAEAAPGLPEMDTFSAAPGVGPSEQAGGVEESARPSSLAPVQAAPASDRPRPPGFLDGLRRLLPRRRRVQRTPAQPTPPRVGPRPSPTEPVSPAAPPPVSGPEPTPFSPVPEPTRAQPTAPTEDRIRIEAPSKAGPAATPAPARPVEETPITAEAGAAVSEPEALAPVEGMVQRTAERAAEPVSALGGEEPEEPTEAQATRPLPDLAQKVTARQRPAQVAPARAPAVQRADAAEAPETTEGPVHGPSLPRVQRAEQARPGVPPAQRPTVQEAPPLLPATEPLPAPGAAMAQYTIDSREALQRAMQPRTVFSVVQTAAEASEAQSEDAGETPEQAGDQAGQDLDALARDVYRIIRRRLLVERERELGRL